MKAYPHLREISADPAAPVAVREGIARIGAWAANADPVDAANVLEALADSFRIASAEADARAVAALGEARAAFYAVALQDLGTTA